MLAFSVYSQLIIRRQVGRAGALPEGAEGKALFILHLLLNPWVMTAIAATLLSGISWMLAMTKFEISYAYPWVSLNFALMLMFGVLLFGESLSLSKILGTLMIMGGIAIVARG
jgi:multidrug transporter EmrE-like cation transporter